MRYRTHVESMSFVRELNKAKKAGQREFMGARLDSVPAWVPNADGSPIVHKLDGSPIEAVYVSYLPADEKQVKQAENAKLAGMKMERISGRLVDVRECKDGTIQVLVTNGLRSGDGKVPFRSFNIDKGILAAVGFNEGLVETEEEILARIPADLLEKLKANKLAIEKARTKKPVDNPNQNQLPLAVPATGPSTPTTSTKPEDPGEGRVKLR